MLRIPVGLFHTFLAAALATAGLWYVAQSQVNLLWEQGFYGAPHPMTLGALFSGALGLTVATAWTAGAVLHGLGVRAGAIVILLMSGGLLLVTPWVIKIALGFCVLSAVIDLLPDLPEAEDDDALDDD